MICEMFAFYKTRGISLLEKIDDIYDKYGYCMNTLHSYEFPSSTGMEKMQAIMTEFHKGLDSVGGYKIVKTEDYSKGLNGLPKSDVLKYFFEGEGLDDSVVIRPSGTEPKLKVYISVTTDNKESALDIENTIVKDIEERM